jgi:hypothetical protein
MKKIILLFCLFNFSNYAFSQAWVGDTLSKIKSENTLGVFDVNPKDTGFFYACSDSITKSKYVFLLDINLVCYTTIVVPNNRKICKQWVESLKLDKDWVKIDNKKWAILRVDGMIISCILTKNSDKQPILIFSKVN